MVVASLVHVPVSPGTRALIARSHKADVDKAAVPHSVAAQIAPNSLLAELYALNKDLTSPRPISTRLYTSRESLLEPASAEEELAWQGNQVIWSKGTAVFRTFNFDRHGLGGQVSQVLFAWFVPPSVTEAPKASTSSLLAGTTPHRGGLFGPFAEPLPPAWTDDQRFGKRRGRTTKPDPTPARALCIFLREMLFIHFADDGRDFYVHLPFKVGEAWAMRTGLLVERRVDETESRTATTLATLYSLSDPLDEFRAVAAVASCSAPALPDHRALSAPVAMPSEHVLLVSKGRKEPPLVFTLDTVHAKLHIYAYVFVSENETRRESERAKAALSQEEESSRAGTGARGRASLLPPSSPLAFLDAGHGRMSVGPPVEAFGIARRMRDAPRPSAARMAEVDRMALGEQHERDTTMIRQASEGDTTAGRHIMRSEVFLARIGEHQLDRAAITSAVSPKDQIGLVLFDSRLPSCLVAVQTRQLNSLNLLWLDINRAGLVARTSDPITAVSMAPVLATRPDVSDLLVLDSDGNLTLLTADSYSVTVETVRLGTQLISPSGLVDACADRVTITTSSDSRVRLSLDLMARSALVQRCLVALSCVGPTSKFLAILTSYLDRRQASPAYQNDWSTFSTGMLSWLGGIGDQSDSRSPYEALLESRHDVPAFRHIVVSTMNKNSLQAAPTEVSTLAERQAALVALHLVAEEAKLLSSRTDDLDHLVPMLAKAAAALGLAEWLDYYRRAGFVEAVPEVQTPIALSSLPFDILQTINDALLGITSMSYPDVRSLDGVTNSRFYGTADPTPLSRCCTHLFALFRQEAETRSWHVVRAINSLQWGIEDVQSLTLGVRVPLLEAIRQCQYNTPQDWPMPAYKLIGREDLVQTAAIAEGSAYKVRNAYELISVEFSATKQPHIVRYHGVRPEEESDASSDQERSGISARDIKGTTESIDNSRHTVVKQFSQDLRLEEVARMLQTWRPVTVRMPDRPDLGEHAIAGENTTLATHVSARTLSLPIGAAMFGFRTERKKPTDTFRASSINLMTKIMPQGVTITPDTAAVAADKRIWADFHSGVAAALRSAAEPGEMDFSDISFNKPDNLDATFGGLLLGLGLTGHIRSMASYQAFAYLDPKQEQTSIGLLLGLAASFMATCDPKVTSVLSVHLSAMHPSDSTGLNVSQAIQAAGMLSLGILHLGTHRRRLADICIRELMQTKVVPLEGPETCREAYTLSLGFAFGFILLGAGKVEPDVLDAPTLRILRNLISGEGLHDLPSTKNSMSSATDVALTSPAATVALALVYLDSGRSDIASLLEIPSAVENFDYVRPDLILLRTLARCLIMRSAIRPTKEWIESLVPDFILAAKLRGRGGRAGSVDIDLAYWSIVAGGVMAMALKYAGLAEGEVHATMLFYFDGVRRFGQLKDPTIQGRFLRRGVRSCASVICMALSVVMAGTGELNVLRRIRVLHGQIGEQWDYGTHLATHMSLGLLFLGGGAYTLSNSPAATAMLLCALYPALPNHAAENRAHIQAARHLWALAVEPRRLVARDVDSDEAVFLPVRVRVHEEGSLRSQKLVTPTLVPELATVESIRVDSPRYMPLRLSLASNPGHLSSFMRSRTLFVKRCGGYLDYARDPKGVRSLFSRSKAEAAAHVFDFGKVPELLGVQKRSTAGNESTLEDSLEPFAGDAMTRGAVKYLCRPHDPRTATFEAFIAALVTETLSNDKPSAFGLYLDMLLAHRLSRGDTGGVMAYRHLRMAYNFYATGLLEQCLPSPPTAVPHKDLVGPAFIAHLSTSLHGASDLLSDRLLIEYLRTGAWPRERSAKIRLAAILARLEAPNVDVIGQLSNVVTQTKDGSTDNVLPLVLEKITGRTPDAALLDAMRQAWA